MIGLDLSSTGGWRSSWSPGPPRCAPSTKHRTPILDPHGATARYGRPAPHEGKKEGQSESWVSVMARRPESSAPSLEGLGRDPLASVARSRGSGHGSRGQCVDTAWEKKV